MGRGFPLRELGAPGSVDKGRGGGGGSRSD